MSLIAAVHAEAVPLQLIKNIGGEYNEAGEFVPDQHQPTDFHGTIQPVTGRVLRDLPEGMRASATYTLWTTMPLADGDVVIYLGVSHRVRIVKHRPEGGFYRAVLGKVGG